MGYTKNALEGFSWQTVLKILTAVVTLLKISILARLLSPDVFGLFSLIVIALGISEATTETGVNLTIIQSKRSIEYFLDTAWVIAIGRGFLIAIVMILMGWGMSSYFNQLELLPLIALTSLVPVIKGFINPAIITWQKELRFFRESSYKLSLTIIEGAFAVVLGLMMQSVLALILALIGGALAEVIISFLILKTKPRFNYLASRAKVIFGNAKWLSLSSLLGYLNSNLDDFVIGKILGNYQLGLYHNGYALSHKTNYEFAQSIHHGTLPIYTKLLQTPARLVKAYWRTLGGGSLLLLAGSIPLVLFPELFVQIILGSQWLEIIPLIKWLVLAGILQSLALLGYSLFLAKGRFLTLNIYQLVNLVLMVCFMSYFGLQTGLAGAVMGLALARLLSLPIIIFGVFHETRLKSRA